MVSEFHLTILLLCPVRKDMSRHE